MDGTEVRLSGRAATNPTISGGKGERISFRAVSTERRFDEASGDWIDGDEFGVTVVCWRALAAAVLQLVRKGDPLVVVGKISTRKFDRDGVTDYFTEIKADHIGFDVARAAGRIKREDGSPALETMAPRAAAEGQAESSVRDDGTIDPFQSETAAESDRELLVVS